jgi:dTDP-4-amino-4,6-dideoxygalactose transaminase
MTNQPISGYKIRFFNPGKGYLKIRPQILGEIDRVLKAGDLILRKDVETFEKNLADYVGTKYAVALNSGTDALYLALRSLKIGLGDEVLVPSRTFVATAQVVVQVGATPVYIDIDGNTYELLHTDKLKAIILVHIEGALHCEFEKLLDLAQKLNIPVIEDAAQALGATQDGRMAGSFGNAGCFSFYPAKILGAYGDAGALTTNDEEIYKYVKDCRNHFKDDARDWGVNSRMDNLQAAILNVKFKYLPEILIRRQHIAERYLDNLNNLPIELPKYIFGRVWQDFIVRTELRNELYEFLKEKGIETLKNNYPFPVPKLPLAQAYEDETLRLPCNENLEDEEVEEVIKAIKEFYAK